MPGRRLRLALGNQAIILDTETTGITQDAEVVQVAGVDITGGTLFDWLVKPMWPIPAEAEAVHHIRNEDVKDCPTFERFAYPNLCFWLEGKVVVAYNAAFDRRMLKQTCNNYGLDEIPVGRWSCAMEMYAQFVGDWSEYHRSFRWQKLEGGDHSALGDCRATLALIRKMAGERLSSESN